MRHHFVRSSAGLRDPNFKNVTLLLHGDGTNGAQNNTFLDSSASNNAITTTGNVAQGSFSPYGDRWSVALAGSSAHLRSANNANLNIGASDFTFECWANGSSFSTDWATFFARWNSNGNYGYFFNYDTDGGLTFIYSTTGLAAGNVIRAYGGTMTVGKWHHVAFCRSGGTTRAFLDGVQIGSSTSDNVTIFNSNGQQVIGGVLDASTIYHPFTGYISNLRLVIGTALYTSNFTPSSTPLTVIANTRILACASNRFEDKSPTALTLNRNGTPSVQRFSPFGPDTLYRTDRIGGSAYFDGGEFLQVANRGLKLTAGFFTAECWVYISAYSGNFYALFDDWYWQGGHNGGWRVFIDSLGRIVMQASNGNWNNWGGTFITSSNSVILNQWNHVAIVRGANDLINIYINGISTTTPVARKELNLNSGSAQSAWQSRIGINASDVVFGGVYNYSFTGTISDLRIINGKCLYTANFTPPTEPLTAIPETTFLGRFANGSIVDNAMMSSLETAGTARISTSQKKYGTGSLEISGNGLNFRNTPNFQFGTGDFTLEFWLWRSSGVNMNNRMVISCWATNGWGILFDGSQQISLSIPTGSWANVVRDPSTFPSDQWVHVAVSRQTGTSRLFINGTLVASAADSNNYVATATVRIGTLDGANWNFVGYLDDLRITKGVARYTANFTPPTTPLPDF